jgi:hypothetical protein
LSGVRKYFLSALASGAILAGSAALADDDVFRCGSKLVSPGVDSKYVLEQCGEPTSRTTEAVPQLGRRQNGTTYETGVVINVERWTYDRGNSRFPAVLKFEEGKLVSIEFVRE